MRDKPLNEIDKQTLFYVNQNPACGPERRGALSWHRPTTTISSATDRLVKRGFLEAFAGSKGTVGPWRSGFPMRATPMSARPAKAVPRHVPLMLERLLPQKGTISSQ
jgi:hypothetical protein